MADSGQAKEGSHGNGLINMRRRAQESGIEFTLNSVKNEGTEIIIHFRI
jgi:signal transduction histidine kinase